MRLERLEINGFKSFSDRSELAFDKGVTAIVGPNGCGKSNVADAITWVMGEQSAKSLRGDRMEDVIFNGSDARKPTATAEVRLRLAGVVKNLTGPPLLSSPSGELQRHTAMLSDSPAHENGQFSGNGHSHGNGQPNGNGHSNGNGYHTVVEEIIQSVAREVEVTRRLYRSGESEYLIDGRVCRLRDIHELLMDTGLGAKAYSIIEQGKIGMILSSRPTDRRQLIEEAAGVTKYKARRRATELKLDAAKQNLTRIDDIACEVEKQRGTLRRQAAKARRYRKLGDELRRWEKVLFARKYLQLGETIEALRVRLSEARERESIAAARVAEMEASVGRVRIELAEAEAHATTAREAAHVRELEINRLQQQSAFDKEQVRILGGRTEHVAGELQVLEARRQPARAALAARRLAASEAAAERESAAVALTAQSDAYEAAHRQIEGLEGDVEASRSEVFSAINSATALRHSLEHAASARERVAETLSKLHVESEDVRIESERVTADCTAAADGLRRAQEEIEATRIARAARESELASARIEHEWRALAVRAREHELAGLSARLRSLEELELARAEYGDAARTILARANGKVNQQGAVADYLEVTPGFERAVEACLGDLLQHVIVEKGEHAAAGFQLVREQRAGRCGFLIACPQLGGESSPGRIMPEDGFGPPDGFVALSSVVRVNGPFAVLIQKQLGDAWITDSYDKAAELSRTTLLPVATTVGDLFRSPHLVVGGSPAEARGILETKREISDLRERIQFGYEATGRLAEAATALESTIAQASGAIAALNAEHHKHEKAVVGFEAQLHRGAEDATRLAHKAEQLSRERRQAEEEREALDRRQEEGRASIAQLESSQRAADERFIIAQRRLFEARDACEELSQYAAQARAVHAALIERASALASEADRLEEAAVELETRAAALAAELESTRQHVAELREAIVGSEARLDEAAHSLERLRLNVHNADDLVCTFRDRAEAHETGARDARVNLEAIRRTVADLDVARATAETNLSHLAATALETVQASLDEIAAEVAEMERQGRLTPDVSVICADEHDDEDSLQPDIESRDQFVEPGAAAQQTLSAEDAIARLRTKIERLGPVNMMAIEQYDELEARHTFLATQRHDLVQSIAQTSEAIKRIDGTTRQRFTEALAAINKNFQETFGTLFGGGRAGLTLLDENDPLESGIEIIAQPPGKRLQSVQLLSGGEKALTAIALMFGLFNYRPSPFCLLDEIDAPLDDANIGRFVEMLQGMQQHTQFILITHNRKTMEIADRLYGVTMEEPGVSKLISVQIN